MSQILAADGLSKSHGVGELRVEAVREASLQVREGEFVAILGASGSGKSSLLHLVGGLARPDRGTVKIEGRDLALLDDEELSRLRRRRIGFVFQAFNLVDVLEARDNVALPLLIDGMDAREARTRAESALSAVGLSTRARHLPGELSGGERQRVAVARALAGEPGLILADEPTGNLDSINSRAVLDLLTERGVGSNRALILVTHDEEAARRAGRIVHMVDGRIVEDRVR